MRTVRGGRSGESATGAVTIEAPDDVDVRIRPVVAAPAATARRSRGAKAVAPASDPILNGLAAASGVTVAADVRLSPPPRRRLRGRALEPTRVKVQAKPGDDAVVLMEGEGGVYSFVYPDKAPAGRRPGTRSVRGPAGAARELTFTLSTPGGGRTTRGGPNLAAIGGWLVDHLTKPVRAVVLTFTANVAIDLLLKKLEGGNKTGLVVVKGTDPLAWRPTGAAIPAAPATRTMKVLLLVHGTFSDTAGSFGQLTTHEDGLAFLKEAYAQYDAVLGFDHKTLAESVETNVTQMAKALRSLPDGTIIDAIAYSRGGLVYRALADEAMATRNVVWRKVVFVGCTNAGTHLASPENWEAMADVYVNALIAGSKVATLLLGTPALNPLVELGIKSLGEFVQILPKVAIDDRKVPGLASMDPEGPTVKRLNAATPAATASEYFAITSDFAPHLTDPTKGISDTLKRLLIDRLTNRLWQNQANDMVVDTKLMDEVGAHKPWLGDPDDTFAYGSVGYVYHTIYFSVPATTAHLRAWLTPPKPALTTRTVRTAKAKRPVKKNGHGAVRRVMRSGRNPQTGDSIVSFSRARGRGRSIVRDELEGAPPESDTVVEVAANGHGQRAKPPVAAREVRGARPARAVSPPKAIAAPKIDCKVAASMPEGPRVGEWTALTVVLSRKDIARLKGQIQAQGGFKADPAQPLRVVAQAQVNCVLGDVIEAIVAAPTDRKDSTVTFQVQGVAPGVGEVWVEVFQGQDRLSQLVLQPTFVQPGDVTASGSAKAGETEGPMLDLRVFEERDGNAWRLRFLLRSVELGLDEEHVSEDFTDSREDYITGLYTQLEDSWTESHDDFDGLMAQIRNRGLSFFQALFPEKLQKILWDNRANIGSIQVFSYEATIPWEACFMFEPGKKPPVDGGEGRFLAELGLTRWFSNFGLAPAKLRLRKDASYYVIPDYLDPEDKLESLKAEAKMVKRVLGARPLEPHLMPVLKALRGEEGGDFDLIHFACHGQAEPGSFSNSSLLLEGVAREGAVRPERLHIDDIKYADLSHGGHRPIIYINACQVGGGGHDLAGSGSLAQMFARSGAGLVVAALWSVEDNIALGFATTFYQGLLAGRSVTQAVRAARQKAKAEKDFTWLAYTVYGHPYARVGD